MRYKNNTINNQNLTNSINTYENKQNNTSQSTISFNNSKNFSIYKNIETETETAKEKDLSTFSDEQELKQDFSPSSFKDRLNKIDMK